MTASSEQPQTQQPAQGSQSQQQAPPRPPYPVQQDHPGNLLAGVLVVLLIFSIMMGLAVYIAEKDWYDAATPEQTAFQFGTAAFALLCSAMALVSYTRLAEELDIRSEYAAELSMSRRARRREQLLNRVARQPRQSRVSMVPPWAQEQQQQPWGWQMQSQLGQGSPPPQGQNEGEKSPSSSSNGGED